ncbi:hypothetical protein NQD34_012493 [Periophthalmus magnuspinnatus]|nr:hypothetical protein NQD34_012493 [Periophthalmus magnuspinnatus]
MFSSLCGEMWRTGPYKPKPHTTDLVQTGSGLKLHCGLFLVDTRLSQLSVAVVSEHAQSVVEQKHNFIHDLPLSPPVCCSLCLRLGLHLSPVCSPVGSQLSLFVPENSELKYKFESVMYVNNKEESYGQ